MNDIMDVIRQERSRQYMKSKKNGGGSGQLETVVSPDEMLCNELNKVIEAGDKLAEAAHYVQSNYDGIHRLRLALSEWYKTRADENGRG